MPNELELYPHNEKAYRKLLDMLSETRRACIIHPTGTGKAFIAYRYAFDHPKERILWMSPSTYIEQEQEASIRRELPNYEFKNIERMTYQTAMHRAQKGNLDIHADTVIFDEFHHTGAPQWSRGVEGVIECNPDANLIGLSATSIRYSDSGRDMSDELFDGHIASYMMAVLVIWYLTFPKAGNRLFHCAVSCVFGAIIVYSLRSTPRALDILCLAVSWELIEKYIESRDIRFLFGFPFLGVFMANVHGALWPCAIMLPLAALLESKLNLNARIALAVTILLTIASTMLNPYGLDVLSLPFKTIGTSDIATVAVPELKPMFSVVPIEAVILIVTSVVPVIFHAKYSGFKKAVFSFETMMIAGLLFLSLLTWRNELLLLGILMIVYSTWCWKLEPKCKVSSKMLSRIVLFSISVVALEFGAVLFYSTLSATDQKSISLERAFQAMREDGAVSGTAVLTDIDPGCRAELNGFKPYLDTRIEVFNGQNGQKNVLAEAGKALSSGNLSAICDDYGMDYAVLNYGINDVGIQDLKESGFKTLYSDGLTVCLKRSTV